MALERTFSIIKPDATRRNLTGQINSRLEAAGLRIVAQKRKQLTQGEAEAFYAVHAERPFYNDLVAFMTSGPVVVQVLEGEGAVAKNRELMGATNPADAAAGAIGARVRHRPALSAVARPVPRWPAGCRACRLRPRRTPPRGRAGGAALRRSPP